MVITLCTGTRNTQRMWRSHPDDGTEDAWRDLVVSMHETAAIGAEYGVTIAFEPEVSNVIDSAQRARRLLDYDLYIRLLGDSGYRGALVLHGLSEAQMPWCVEFLRTRLAAVSS